MRIRSQKGGPGAPKGVQARPKGSQVELKRVMSGIDGGEGCLILEPRGVISASCWELFGALWGYFFEIFAFLGG